ncbi:MAG: hypothetical protein K2M55_00065, partial [Muribaculaceae bacterium]|nr:hypothetical protein [Muribaculaceae bacterium]
HAGEGHATNSSSTFRFDSLLDKAFFADWSDAYSGYWVVDPLNLDAPRYNMLMPEGATQAASGLVTYNGVQTGSGSACVAFGGRGEETMMYGFDEDIYNNQVVGYALGTANYITEAPVLEKVGPYTSFSLNCDMKATDAYHLWVDMGRANSNDSGSTVCFAYYEITKDTMTDDDGEDVLVYTSEQLWNSAGKDLFEDGTNGAFAVSPDGKTIVADSQNGKMLYVFDVEFNQWGEPEVTLNRTIEVTALQTGARRGQMAFDAAGNLHFNCPREMNYQVWSFKGQSVATTPAKAADVLTIASGVENLQAAQDAPVEYFNLNGVRVAADNLTPGLYIRRQGTQATKVLVK